MDSIVYQNQVVSIFDMTLFLNLMLFAGTKFFTQITGGNFVLAAYTPSQRRKIPVVNARKVWGTLKSSTCSTVATVFKKLISQSLADRLTVKRKYITNSNGSVQRWWYVIRGEELDLAELEKAWEAIATQTSWKLEPLFRFDNHDKTTSPHL